jgi:DNA helicase-2/ATP-dependent DNA helicase PcrA
MQGYIPTAPQIQILEAEASAIVVAGPGTGKTRTAIEKARYHLRKDDEAAAGRVLFLSFSNAAVQRLASAAGVELSYAERRRVRLSTYHSCAAEILRNYGRFVGLTLRTQIMDTLEEKLVALENGWDLSDDGHQRKLLDLAKQRGLLAFSTLIPLASSLLSASERLRRIIARQFPLVIVDEFQDSSGEQWGFLKRIGQESQVIAFGDPNQIIYERMHGATAARFDEFKGWKGIEETRFGVQNFRCSDGAILRFGEALLQGRFFDSLGQTSVELLAVRYRKQLRAHLALQWKKIRDANPSGCGIGILVPSNQLAEEVAVTLRTPTPGTILAFPVYARLSHDAAAHDSVLLAIAAVRDFVIRNDEATCKKAAIALLAMDLQWNSRKKMSVTKLTTVVKMLAACRAGDGSGLATLMGDLQGQINLKQMIPKFIESLAGSDEFKTSCTRILAHETLGVDSVVSSDGDTLLFDDLRTNRAPKGLAGYEAPEGKTVVLNYHKAKGREFDAVVMIVDPRQESSKMPLDEQRRLYYVCATRAKRHLSLLFYPTELGRVLGPVLTPPRVPTGM